MDVDSPLGTISLRTPFGRLRERDIDLLFCSELHANSGLARFLAARLSEPLGKFSGAWVSHAEYEGESDLVVTFDVDNGVIVALIENKIDAEFQPEQASRYSARAARWRASQEGVRVVTILLAPAEYFASSADQIFDLNITYEEVVAALRSENDPRTLFLADALTAGIEAACRRYVMVPNPSVSSMWMDCWKMSCELTPKLNFREPGSKPGRSAWFYFGEAEGFSDEDTRRVVLVYKARHGCADLQFAQTSRAELTAIAGDFLESEMKIRAVEKSASIRVEVPVIDFTRPALDQRKGIIEGFAACERLRLFFIENRHRLLRQDLKSES